MGPFWMHASEVTHVPMKYSIWHEDPPASSYPSCIAAKTASLQLRDAEDLYFQQIRKALMQEGKNIAKVSVLFEIAKKLDSVNFSLSNLNLIGKQGVAKIYSGQILKKQNLITSEDIQHSLSKISGGEGIMIVGYRPYDVLLQAYQKFKQS
jgi:hypothetical protein